MNKTTGYRIESAMIPQTQTRSEEVWFLDAVQESEFGGVRTSNICSGTKGYCQEVLNDIRTGKMKGW